MTPLCAAHAPLGDQRDLPNSRIYCEVEKAIENGCSTHSTAQLTSAALGGTREEESAQAPIVYLCTTTGISATPICKKVEKLSTSEGTVDSTAQAQIWIWIEKTKKRFSHSGTIRALHAMVQDRSRASSLAGSRHGYVCVEQPRTTDFPTVSTGTTIVVWPTVPPARSQGSRPGVLLVRMRIVVRRGRLDFVTFGRQRTTCYSITSLCCVLGGGATDRMYTRLWIVIYRKHLYINKLYGGAIIAVGTCLCERSTQTRSSCCWFDCGLILSIDAAGFIWIVPPVHHLLTLLGFV